MSKDYKAEFLKKIKEKKAKTAEDKKARLEMIKQSKETYKRVCSEFFITQVLDAVSTIKKEIRKEMKDVYVGLTFSHLSAIKDQFYVHFEISENEEEYRLRDQRITLEAHGNSIMLYSNCYVLEKKNDLGDSKSEDSVHFPMTRGKTELDDEEIKEIHNQFIRALYSLAQDRMDNLDEIKEV